MTRSGGEGKSVLYYGCVGCGVLVGLVALAAAGLAGLAWMEVQGERVEQRELSREVERPTVSDTAVPTGSETREASPSETAFHDAAGRVVLDFSGGDCRVRPGAPGTPVRVDARYDANAYELVQDETTSEDGTWEFDLRFRRTGNALITTIKEMLGGTKPEVVVELPPDVPLDLDATTYRGGLILDLEGLWLVDVALDGSQGGVVVDADRPTVVPVERMDVRASMGGFVIAGLDNLSPRELSIDVGMGGAVVEGAGTWRTSSTIKIANRRGGVQLVLAKDQATRGLDAIKGGAGPTPPPADAELPGTVLTFELSGDLEDIEVTRR